MTKHIVIGTGAFPFHPGEQFLEDEIEYWSDLGKNVRVRLMPAAAEGTPRAIPDDIRLELRAANTKKWMKIFASLLSLDLKSVPSEILLILKSGEKIPSRCAALGLSILRVGFYRSVLKRIIKDSSSISLFYSYWNSEMAYAATSLKGSGVSKVISRAHGNDLYEERRKSTYLPLKRYYAQRMDKVFVLADSARDYFERTYNVGREIVSVTPLGVPLKELTPRVPVDHVFSIVSVSYCVPVKRVEKIILAVKHLAPNCKSKKIRWTHIGSGPLLNRLKSMAEVELGEIKNIEHQFLGNKDNSFVKDFYYQNDVTCFLNVSDSEGMPVSIMEAMAAGVPVVAPNVGGISELLDSESGLLLSKDPSPELIGAVLRDNYEFFNDIRVRTAARKRIDRKFNSRRNYISFVKNVMSIIEADHGN